MNSQVIGLMHNHFQGRAGARALGAYIAVSGIAATSGPLIAGIALNAGGAEQGWRAALLVSTVLGLVATVLAIACTPRRRPSFAGRPSLDVPGLAMIALITLLLLLPFVNSADSGSTAVACLGLAFLTACLFAGWEVYYSRTGRVGVIVPSVARSGGFALGSLVAGCYFVAVMSLSLLLSVFFQEGLGFSPLRSALVNLPGSAAMAVSAALSPRLVTRYGRASVCWAIALGITGVAATLVCSDRVPTGQLAVVLAMPQLLTGAASGTGHPD